MCTWYWYDKPMVLIWQTNGTDMTIQWYWYDHPMVLIWLQNTAIWSVNCMALISVEPRCNNVEPRCNNVEPRWCFLATQTYGWSLAQAVSMRKQVWLAAGSACCRWSLKPEPRHRLWFLTQTHHLVITKLCLDHPHCHQISNQTVYHTKIPHVIS